MKSDNCIGIFLHCIYFQFATRFFSSLQIIHSLEEETRKLKIN